MLLVEVFENFCNIRLKTYNLDPVHYYMATGFSFDSMLKYTGIKFELLPYYERLLMFEKGIRDELTQTSMRYAKANNYTTTDFDETKSKSWLIYQDRNYLYRWAMSQFMQYGGLKCTEPTLDGLDKITKTSHNGCMYEVDISYPPKLHDKHKDLPFLTNNSKPLESTVQKFIATLKPKTNYVISSKNMDVLKLIQAKF